MINLRTIQCILEVVDDLIYGTTFTVVIVLVFSVRQDLHCSWTSNLELYADNMRICLQPFQSVAEDVFIWRHVKLFNCAREILLLAYWVAQ